jgi:hypothetical protein
MFCPGSGTKQADGHFSLVNTRADLPKFASNRRDQGTPEENKAVVQGSIAYFGTYSVNEGIRSSPLKLRGVRLRT